MNPRHLTRALPPIDDIAADFLLAEYEHLSSSYISNEEIGDNGVNTYLVIVGGLFAISGISSQSRTPELDALMAVAMFVVFLLGLLILARLTRRNAMTDFYLSGLEKIRRAFIERSDGIWPILTFPPGFKLGHGAFRVGLVQLVVFVNSLVFIGGWALDSGIRKLVPLPALSVTWALVTWAVVAAIQYILADRIEAWQKVKIEQAQKDACNRKTLQDRAANLQSQPGPCQTDTP